jgi:hypothetical protein
MNWRKLDTETRRALIMARLHMSCVAIGRELGINKGTVRDFCTAQGIALPDGRVRRAPEPPIDHIDESNDVWAWSEDKRREAFIRRAAEGARKARMGA